MGKAQVKEKVLSKREVIGVLTKSPHGKLEEYLAPSSAAAKDDPNFFGHLCAWNQMKGTVRDAKVALPLIGWSHFAATEEFEALRENSRACLASLSLRDLLRAWRFSRSARIGTKMLDSVVRDRLRALEAKTHVWERAAMQHRKSLKELYALTHTAPSSLAQAALFDNDYLVRKLPALAAVSRLSKVSATEAAGLVAKFKIPFLVAVGAAGANSKDEHFVLALIDSMSPTELVTNSKKLEKLGLNTTPSLRAAYDQALDRAKDSKKQVLKSGVAASKVVNTRTKEKLEKLQETQIGASQLKGNWLILADKSGSMSSAIELAKELAGVLAAYAEKVNLTFFDTSAQSFDVSGKSLSEIKKQVGPIRAGGGTSIGVGLHRALTLGEQYDGIIIVSDFEENCSPYFKNVFLQYQEKISDPSVYCMDVNMLPGSPVHTTWGRGKECVQEWIGVLGVDYHSLPNLVLTMRANRYTLVDEILATPLLTMKEVLSGK